MPAEYAASYARKTRTPAEAVAELADGQSLLVAAGPGQPPALLAAIAERVRSGSLKNLKLYYMVAMEPLAQTLLADDVLSRIEASTFFVAGPDHRQAGADHVPHLKQVNFIPGHFSQVPRIIEEHLDLDMLVASVSPLDAGGCFSLGTNNDYTSLAARRCRRLVVEVNRNMPRVFGQSQIHLGEVAALVENDVPLPAVEPVAVSPEAAAIGQHLAPLVPNGATLQLGIGKIPAGVAQAFAGHEALGIHTELFSPALAELIASGAATGERKTLHPRKHVFTVATGDAAMYRFMNDNGALESYPSSYVNDVRVIAAHDNFMAINTAIEVDLYGQVNAEFFTDHQYSGSGGQYDFVKGASLSRGGKSFIALQSTARGGRRSTIVPKVEMVTDLRMDVEYVVTEQGIVNLRGKSMRARAEALIAIAHPDHRGELRAAAKRLELV